MRWGIALLGCLALAGCGSGTKTIVLKTPLGTSTVTRARYERCMAENRRIEAANTEARMLNEQATGSPYRGGHSLRVIHVCLP